MGASITVERIAYTERRYQIDRLGYLFCGDCIDPKRGGQSDSVPTNEQPPSFAAPCDCCGRGCHDWPVTEAFGTAVIEHTTCLIL